MLTGDLHRPWRRLVESVDADVAEAVLTDLVGRYGERHRAYHTLEHIADVLTAVDDLIAAGEPVADPVAVRLAGWFHDAVYVPGAPGNETRSAELAVRTLTGWPVDAARVHRLVLATADHVADDADAAVLVDADLAVLARDPAGYGAYVRAVRAEYRQLDDATWRRGRANFLGGMLARERIFATTTMRRAAEATARANLRRELAGLP